MAVITGFVVDVLLSAAIGLLAGPLSESLANAPDPTRSDHLLLLGLYIASTAVGGYVAGRIAHGRHALHGLLVGVVGVILSQLPALGGPALPRIFIVASALRCLAGLLGGLVSRHLPPPRPPIEG